MSLKKAIKFQLYDIKRSVFWFSFIIICIYTLSLLLKLFTGVKGNISGMDISSFIFVFVLGIVNTKPYFLMLLQNGISRKTYVTSLFISNLITCAILSAINVFFNNTLARLSGSVSFVEDILYSVTDTKSFFLKLLLSFVFLFLLSLSGISFGMFIGSLYYKMYKTLIVSIGVPLFFFFILPILIATIPPFAHFISSLFAFCFDTNLKLFLSLFVISAIFNFFSSLLVSKFEVK